MFNETRLLDSVAYGSEFGQEFSTRVTTLRSGVERRNANWSMPLGRYAVLYQVLKPDDHIKVRAAHMASMGALIPFRFKDYTDYQAQQQIIGTGTGSAQTLPLLKQYKFGPVELQRRISKPVLNTVLVFADGVPVSAAVDYVDGTVTITADVGAEITWSGEFDIPVRFESDRLDVEPLARIAGGFAVSCNVDLVEVRL